MTDQEKRILTLEVRLRVLEQFLSTSAEVPPLGPLARASYEDALKVALKTVGLTPTL